MSEFSLIERWFTSLTPQRDDVSLGIGDDCAVLNCPEQQQLLVSIDTLVEGVHFFADVDPEALGHKALAVNLSDLAAMAATPAWFTLALTLPERNEAWLQRFSQGLLGLAQQHNIQLVGGDTTRGPLSISIQVHGFAERNKAVRRDGAKVGDHIFVSGSLGDAGAALQQRLGSWQATELSVADKQYLQQRLERPTPRNNLTALLRRYANAAIDISDGLLADLGHILKRSQVGARINVDQLPLSPVLKKLTPEQAQGLALMSGDDYELCFTVAAEHVSAVLAESDDIHCIGKITADERCELVNTQGESISTPNNRGYDHFND